MSGSVLRGATFYAAAAARSSQDELLKTLQRMSSSSSQSSADTTPSSPHEDGGLVHGPDPYPTGPAEDPCSFAESIAMFKQDAAAQEYVVALFMRILDRYISG